MQNLLQKLEPQETNGLFTYSLVVVDNDSARSAEEIVEKFRQESALDVTLGEFAPPAVARDVPAEPLLASFRAVLVFSAARCICNRTFSWMTSQRRSVW